MGAFTTVRWLLVVIVALLAFGFGGGPPWPQGMLALRKRWGRWRDW
jgi:hypothetical protein